MKATWYQAEAYFFNSHDPGTVTIFLKYDLRCWSFGLRFEPDECWYSMHLDFGPLEMELCYWRFPEIT
jgi:hypothetical protein